MAIETILQILPIIIGFCSLIVALFGAKLYEILKERHIRRILLEKFSRGPFDDGVIQRATRFFIKQKCQNLDPARETELRHALTATKDNLFKVVDDFIKIDTPIRHLMILADSGTGKTTFSLNYYASHAWKKEYHIALVPLGHPDSDNYISGFKEPEKTVIILDAFDEDSRGIEDHRKRITDLMDMCKKFKRVIITCRTQFFHKDEEIPLDTGILRFDPREAGIKRTYEFRKIYLSPFSDKDVKKYLAKRFPVWQYSSRRKALNIALKAPLLSARPMLLAHIPEVIAAGRPIDFVYQIYEIMIEAWLDRESGWVNKDHLREFSERLAVQIWVDRKSRNMERIPHDELLGLAKIWQIPLKDWQLSSRSLLNRDAEGNFKFAHRSIMEYLFVRRILKVPTEQRQRIKWTDLMKSFLIQQLTNKTACKNLQRVDLSESNLIGVDLTGYDLTEADFRKSILEIEPLVTIKSASLNFTGATVVDSKAGMKFVSIPPGQFNMGSPDDEIERVDNEVRHHVTLTQGFFLQTTLVTQKQWNMVMGGNPSHFKNGGENCPVENVSWRDVQEFIEKLNQKWRNYLFRLPTEAEWEYACRAGTKGKYYTGNSEADLDRAGWYKMNSGVKTHPVGEKEPNAHGLYDMHGNVWEWCQDWYGEYPEESVVDPIGPAFGSFRVLRGGSWNDSAGYCRAAERVGLDPSSRGSIIGFRLVLLPGQQGKAGT